MEKQNSIAQLNRQSEVRFMDIQFDENGATYLNMKGEEETLYTWESIADESFTSLTPSTSLNATLTW